MAKLFPFEILDIGRHVLMLEEKLPLNVKIITSEINRRPLAPITDMPLRKFKSSQSRSDLRLDLIRSYDIVKGG